MTKFLSFAPNGEYSPCLISTNHIISMQAEGSYLRIILDNGGDFSVECSCDEAAEDLFLSVEEDLRSTVTKFIIP